MKQSELIERMKQFRDTQWNGDDYLSPFDIDLIDEAIAEIKRQDAVIERLGGDEKFTVSKQGSYWICDRCGLGGAAPGDLEGHQCTDNREAK